MNKPPPPRKHCLFTSFLIAKKKFLITLLPQPKYEEKKATLHVLKNVNEYTSVKVVKRMKIVYNNIYVSIIT